MHPRIPLNSISWSIKQLDQLCDVNTFVTKMGVLSCY